MVGAWDRDLQRCAIYSMVIFDDSNQQRARIVSPRQQKRKLAAFGDLDVIFRTGGKVANVFDLCELIAKLYPINDMSFRILDKLIPTLLGVEESEKPEEKCLEISKMKLTDKLAKMNFDSLKFFEILDPKGKNTLELESLFTELGDSFKVFFTVEEQLAVRNELFPGNRDEPVNVSKKRKV